MSKILLVEDDIFVRELYQRQLQKAGYQIIIAKDGKEGWELALQLPDLILLDIMLPFQNGIELLKKYKADEQIKNIPVILLTNLGQTEIIKSAYEIGAQGYLLKLNTTPYNLIDIVKKYLDDPHYILDYNKLDLD